MLYQLSYSPRQFKIYRTIQTSPLAVLWRFQSQIDGSPAGYQGDREKVAAVERVAVDGHRVDLVLRVAAPNVARGRGQPGSLELHLDDRAFVVQAAPFTLHAEDPVANVETEVVPRVFVDRAED